MSKIDKNLNCPNCGKENPKGSRFCQDCGNDLIVSEAKSVNKKSKRKYYIIGAVILVIIIAGAFVSTWQNTYQKFDSSLIKAVEGGAPASDIIPLIEENKNLMIQFADAAPDKSNYDKDVAIANEYYSLRISYVNGEISKEKFLQEAKKIQQKM